MRRVWYRRQVASRFLDDASPHGRGGEHCMFPGPKRGFLSCHGVTQMVCDFFCLLLARVSIRRIQLRGFGDRTHQQLWQLISGPEEYLSFFALIRTGRISAFTHVGVSVGVYHEAQSPSQKGSGHFGAWGGIEFLLVCRHQIAVLRSLEGVVTGKENTRDLHVGHTSILPAHLLPINSRGAYLPD